MLRKVICLLICAVHCSVQGTHRYHRASGSKLSDVINHFQLLSRISNGISLEIGFSDGSFPHNDVIAELLHLGNLKPKDIQDLDQAAIESAMKQLDSLPEQKVLNQDVMDLEKRLIDLTEISGLPKSFATDFANFTGKAEYEAYLKKVKSLKSVNDKIKKIRVSVGGAFLTFSTLSGFSTPIDSGDVDYTIQLLPALLTNIGRIETFAGNFEKNRRQIIDAKGIREASKFIKILHEERKYREETLKRSFDYEEKDVKEMLQSIEKAQKVAQPMKDLKTSFQSIHQLILSRGKLLNQPFEFTAGFPSGVRDLEQLRGIENESVIKRIANSSLLIHALQQGFDQFSDFSDSLKNIEATWTPLTEPATIKSVLRVTETQLKVASLPDSKTISNSLDQLKQCDKLANYPDPDFSKLESAFKTIEVLNNAVMKLDTLEVLNEFKDFSILKTSIDISTKKTNAEKEAAVRDVVAKLKSDEKLKKAIESLKFLQTTLTSAETAFDTCVKEASGDIMKEILKYHNKIIKQTDYLPFYTCLNQAVSSGSSAKDSLKVVQSIAELSKKQKSDHIVSVFNSIFESQKDLGDVRNYLTQMKTPDVCKYLRESFPNSKDVTRTLGMAAQGLVAIQIAYAARSDLQPLLDKIDDISKDDGSLEILEQLRSLAKTFNEIEVFVMYLDGVKGFRRKRATTGFKDDQRIFVEAGKISAWSLDLKKIEAQKISSWKADMEKFRTEVGAVSGNHKAALDKLETLDLKFSKFKFSQAVSSLAALDDFFTLFSAKLMLQPLVAPPNVKTLPPDNVKMEHRFILEPDAMADSAILLFVIIVISLVLFCICYACSYCWGFCDVVDNDDPEDPVENQRSKNLKTPKLTVTPVNEENGVPPKPETKNKEETTKDKSKRTENKNSGEGKNKELVPGKEKPKEDKATIKKVTDKTGAEEKAKEKVPEKAKEVKPADEEKKYGPPKRRKPEEKDRSAPTQNCQALRRKPTPDEGGLVSKREQRSAPRSLKRKTPVPQLVPNLRAPDGQLDNETVFNGVISQCLMISSKCSDSRKWPNECISDLIGTWGEMEAKGLHSYYVISNPTQRIDTHRGCLKESMIPLIGYLNDFFNGSQIKLPGSEKTWNVAQNPLDGTEIEIWRNGNQVIEKEKISTMEKFFAAVWQQEIVAVVRFTPFERDGKKVCGRWHKDKVGESMEFGQWKVETVKKERGVKSFKNATYFTEYKLELTDLKRQESKSVTVILFPWDNPRDTRDSLDIIKYLDNTPGNVMMLDRTGLGPSCVIMAIKCGIQLSLTVRVTSLSEFVLPIRKWRLGAIRTPEEVLYMILSITQGLMDIRNVEFARAYHTYEFFHDRTLRGKYIRDRKRKGTDTYHDGLKLEKHLEEKFEKFEEDKRRREMRMEKQSREDRTDEDVEEQQGEVWEVQGDRDDGNNVANGNQGLGNEKP